MTPFKPGLVHTPVTPFDRNHGIDYATVGAVAAIPGIAELNIGHFLIGEAIFTGLDASVRRMRVLMDDAR